jgi:hypothetical protein
MIGSVQFWFQMQRIASLQAATPRARGPRGDSWLVVGRRLRGLAGAPQPPPPPPPPLPLVLPSPGAERRAKAEGAVAVAVEEEEEAPGGEEVGAL